MAVLSSIPGVGIATAIALIVGLSGIGSLSAKDAAMIAGLAPMACDGGDHDGARHIRGGRPHLRRALYMAALSASRRDPALKIFYDRLMASRKKAESLSPPSCESSSSSPIRSSPGISTLGTSSCLTPVGRCSSGAIARRRRASSDALSRHLLPQGRGRRIDRRHQLPTSTQPHLAQSSGFRLSPSVS